LAPTAVASTNGALLSFTGLHDNFGVPVGDYYLSLASAKDQITQAGPAVTDPASAVDWLTHAAMIAGTSQFTAAALDFECGCFVALIALALWIMKALTAGYWLTLIGGIAQAVTAAVDGVFTKTGILLIAIPAGVWWGLMRIRRGEHGTGWMTVLVGLTMPVLTVTVFSDPAGLMYGPGGVLDFGRRVGFSVAQTVHPGGMFTGSDFSGQVDTMTSSLVTHVVREPIQMWNFGHVVDTNPACATAYTTALRTGIKDAPIRALHQCGDSQAVAYALHVDGTNIWVGAVFILIAVLIGYVMAVCGWCVLKVLIKALWATAAITVALWMGAIFQRRALNTVAQFFRHGIEVMTYVIYASVVGSAIEYVTSHTLPPELGGSAVFPRILILGLLALAAIMLLHHIHHELTGQPPGTVRAAHRIAQVGTGMAIGAAVSGGAGTVAAGARSLLNRGGQSTPWEQLDAAQQPGTAPPSSQEFDPILPRGDTETSVEPVPVGAGEPTLPQPATPGQTGGAIPASASAADRAARPATPGPQWLTEAEHSDMLAAEIRDEMMAIPTSESAAAAFEPIGGKHLEQPTSADTADPQAANSQSLDVFPDEPSEFDPPEGITP
jgi:hypothetical protein